MCNFIFLYYNNRKYNNYYIYIYYLFLYFTAETFTKFIPGYNNKNNNSLINQNIQLNQSNNNQINNYNNLNQQLNDEKIKNKKLESEIQQLRKELSSNKQIQLQQEKKINSLTIKNQQLEKEIQNLRNENQNIKNKQNNQININEINKLNQIIMQKDNKIKELELKLQKNEKIKIYKDDIICINFMSSDKAINTSIACTAEDTFAEVEEKLYQMYNEYRSTNNILLHDGDVILRFKKIKENKIKNGDKIIVQIPE